MLGSDDAYMGPGGPPMAAKKAESDVTAHDAALVKRLDQAIKRAEGLDERLGMLMTANDELSRLRSDAQIAVRKLEAENTLLREVLCWSMARSPQVVGWISCGGGTGIWRCFECSAVSRSTPDGVEHKPDCRWLKAAHAILGHS